MAVNIPMVLHHIDTGGPVVTLRQLSIKVDHAGASHPIGVKIIHLTAERIECSDDASLLLFDALTLGLRGLSRSHRRPNRT